MTYLFVHFFVASPVSSEKDENVFDIQQGVSVNIFIKNSASTSNYDVFYTELYGKRKKKYQVLVSNSIDKINWKKLQIEEPYYFFVNKDFSKKKDYESGFIVNEAFISSNSGIKTDRDKLFYSTEKSLIQYRFEKLLSGSFDNNFKNTYNVKNSGSYKITEIARNKEFHEKFIRASLYRPFDIQWTYYDPNIISRPAQKVMKHFFNHENLGLILGRQGQVIGHMPWNLILLTEILTDYNVFYRGGGYVFPLYLYPEETDQQSTTKPTRQPNLNPEIVDEIAKKLGLTFTPEVMDEAGNVCMANSPEVRGDLQGFENLEGLTQFAPIDLLDYIYAVLHAPSYREKYKEFLKIDFPRVPYPEDPEQFWQLVRLGGELRQLHLLESDQVNQFITTYPQDGPNTITRKITKTSPGWVPYDSSEEKDSEVISSEVEKRPGKAPAVEGGRSGNEELGRVYINDEQYFDNVPKAAWEFYIGGYQPAQKWLKDRKGRELSIEDVRHYQKIIVALTETERIMGEIDGVVDI